MDSIEYVQGQDLKIPVLDLRLLFESNSLS